MPNWSIVSLLTLVILLATTTPVAQPLYAQQAGIIADTPELTFTLAPGLSATRSVKLTNIGTQSLIPLIYEAHASSMQPATVSTTQPLRVALPQQKQRLDPVISRMVAESNNRPIEMLIFLHEQVDLRPALSISNWAKRGEYVYRALKQHADTTQSGLRAQLMAQQIPYRPLWIVNAIRILGTPTAAQELTLRSDVALVMADQVQAAPPPAQALSTNAACSPDRPSNPICWNIRAIGADRVWDEFGVNGSGVTIATIDTGALFSHPALTYSYRGYLADGVFEHRYNWYDPQGVLAAPVDRIGHGTHVLGTIVGSADNTLDQPAIGVAPGATWIAAQGTEGDLIAAAEWMLAPTDPQGNNPRPDLRPMVVNSSWGGIGGNPWYAGYIAAWRAAGIIPVFAAGNGTPQNPAVCGSVASPADDPQAIAVGALDHQNQIAPFSLRGPSSVGGLKPDLSAPGTYQTGAIGIYSTSIGSGGVGYQGLQGTSMAAPHVSGAIALMLAANPALIGEYDAIYSVLTGSAHGVADTRCGEVFSSPNNAYGYGTLDAFAAVSQVRVDVPWLSVSEPTAIGVGQSAMITASVDAQKIPGPGTYQARIQIYPADLAHEPTTVNVTVVVASDEPAIVISGFVTDAESGLPLAAQVSIGGLIATTNPDGHYTLQVFPGEYTLIAQALGYFSQERTVARTNRASTADFVLQPDQPRIILRSDPTPVTPQLHLPVAMPLTISNPGTRPLQYQVFVIPETFGVWRSDEVGGPTPGVLSLPLDTPALAIQPGATISMPLDFEFPFFGKQFNTIYIGSNGVVSFIAPIVSDQPTTRCRPDRQIYLFSAAPFWADLDLSRGGRVHAAHLAHDTVVVSYEQVPLRDAVTDETYSFQVVLHADGRIVFRYGELGVLPQQLGVGVQHVPGDDQTLGCGSAAPPATGLAMELRPQPAADFWLSGATIGSVQPGSQNQAMLTASWLPPGAWPFRGRVRVVSSDPTHMLSEVTFTVAPISAPYRSIQPLIVR
jgi:subtilisin family serine protease